jgi:hypothetical protein
MVAVQGKERVAGVTVRPRHFQRFSGSGNVEHDAVFSRSQMKAVSCGVDNDGGYAATAT